MGTLERVLSVGESVVSVSELVLPAAITQFLGQVLSKSKAALDVTQRAIAAAGGRGDEMLIGQALRRLCEDGPVVCVIETPDANAGGLWADLVGLFARRVAKDVPLLLVLTADGPEHLGAHEDDEPAALNVARQLTAEDVDVAIWQWLAPLTVEDLSHWTGPCAPGVLGSLLEITSGQGGWSTALWRDWREHDVVEDITDGSWRFTRGRERLFDHVDEVVEQRVRRLIGGDLTAIARIERMLACAALEGRRFTAPAVAAAGGRDSNETIDFLDDVLSVDRDRPDGLVIDDGFETISDEGGTRHLSMYRFARELDWQTLRHHGLSDAEQRHLAPRLADAIEELYGGHANRVANTLQRLFAVAGDTQRAGHYQRMADNGISRDVVLWRARNVLATADPVEPAERRRASQLLIAAAEELLNVGPFNDGLAFASAAHRLAELRDDHARALYLTARHLIPQGAYDQARAALIETRHLYRELGDPSSEADARFDLAGIDALEGHYEHARAEFTAVLALYRELGYRGGEAAARYELAVIDRLQGDYEQARAEFTAVLALRRELGDRSGEAHARLELAVIDRLQGDYEQARAEFTAVLALYRELGDPSGEARARYHLAVIDRLQGDYEHARAELAAVLALHRKLRDRTGEANASQQLAGIALLQGDYEQARAEFTAVLALRHELGDRSGEADTRYELAVIDRLKGDYERARAEFTAVLALRRELGDRSGEADARHELDALDKAAEA